MTYPLLKDVTFREICTEVRSIKYVNHWFHRYPGKLIPQIPRFFLEMTLKTDKMDSKLILDPFCGSGTVLVESMLSGNNSIGIDVNPLAVLISKVKTTKLDPEKLRYFADFLVEDISIQNYKCYNVQDFPDVEYWFSSDVNKVLTYIRNQIEQIDSDNYKRFFLVVFSSIIRSVSYADPKIMPACKSKKMREIIENGWCPNVFSVFKKRLYENISRHEDFMSLCPDNVWAEVFDSNALTLPVADETIDLIITSPPYINAQKYIRSTKNEMYWLDLVNGQDDLSRIGRSIVGNERRNKEEIEEFSKKINKTEVEVLNVVRKIANLDLRLGFIVDRFFKQMETAINEMYRVLVKGAKLVMIIGNNTIKDIKVPSNKIFINLCKKTGFNINNIYVDNIINRGLMTKRNKTADIINEEWVIVVEK